MYKSVHLNNYNKQDNSGRKVGQQGKTMVSKGRKMMTKEM